MNHDNNNDNTKSAMRTKTHIPSSPQICLHRCVWHIAVLTIHATTAAHFVECDQ